MWCKNCGKENEDGVKFCVNCGAPVEVDENVSPISESPQVEQPVYAEQPVYEQPVYEQPAFEQQMYVAPKKSVMPIIIAIVVVVALLVGGGVFAFTQSTPEATALKFYSAFLKKDATTVLDNMYQSPKGTPIPKADMEAQMKDMDLSKVDANSLKVYSAPPASYTDTPKTSVDLDGTPTTDFKTVYMSIMVDGKESATAVYLVKSGKSFLLFDKWAVVF